MKHPYCSAYCSSQFNFICSHFKLSRNIMKIIRIISYSSWPMVTLVGKGVIIFQSPLNIGGICRNLLNSRILQNSMGL
jgi:hypothetical protein